MALKAYNELAFRATKNREDSELNIYRNWLHDVMMIYDLFNCMIHQV